MNRLPRTILAALLLLLLLLCGCASSAERIQAIADAVAAYSDYYIEVRDLAGQVQAQADTQQAGQGAVDYTISVDIPDYTELDPSAVTYSLPSIDLSALNTAAYQAEASLALRRALETYALENTLSTYIRFPVTVSLVSTDNGWKAVLSSQGKLAIQQTVEGLVSAVLQKNETYLSQLSRMQAAAALPELLADAFCGAAYADRITVTDVQLNADGTYDVFYTFPEPAFIFSALAEEYASSYNQPFYGESLAAQLSVDGIDDIDLAGAPLLNASATVSLDSGSGTFSLLDGGQVADAVLEAKQAAEADISDVINGAWRVPPLESPSSGSILEGKSSGNSIVFKTNAELGAYAYVRFYEISGEDQTEEGTLALGVFIRGGKVARFRLPNGYYRVTCEVGEHWYGLEHLFGSDGITYDGGNAIHSQPGYENTLYFE